MSIDLRDVCTLLQVFDMPTSVRFYRDILGFEVVETSPRVGDQFDWGLLRLNSTKLMLNTAYEVHDRPPSPDQTRTFSHGDTCLYFSCPEVEATYQHLMEKGIDLQPPTVAPYGMKQLYVSDPDGYMLCFQWSTA